MKKAIKIEKAPPPIGPYSQALEVDGVLYCSGQIPMVPETGEILTGDIVEQAKQVMKNAEEILKQAGYGFSDVIKSTIFLTDLGNFQKVNEVYGSCFDPPFPARSCVQVAALPKGVGLEIELLARKS